MSHKAVSWALEQSHLKPAPWVVLIMLADRHNKDTFRIDPDQFLLASDCNMGRSTVNRHLSDLEQNGLIIRVPRQNQTTRKKYSTYYILEMNFANPPVIDHATFDYMARIREVQNGNIDQIRVPNRDMETVSQKQAIPCPDNEDFRVPNRDTNLVKEPVREPCASEAEPQTTFNLELFASKFLDVFPRVGSKSKVVAALEKAVTGGADPEHVLSAAAAYAAEQKGNETRYIAFAENWLEQKRWASLEKPISEKVATRETVNIQRAQAIIDGKSWTIGSTSPDYARELVHLGLVTEAQCRATGVRL